MFSYTYTEAATHPSKGLARIVDIPIKHEVITIVDKVCRVCNVLYIIYYTVDCISNIELRNEKMTLNSITYVSHLFLSFQPYVS